MSLQSDVGQELLAAHGLPTDTLESIVLIEGNDCYVKSGAVARIAAHLGGVYALDRCDTFRDQFATERMTSSPPVAIGGSGRKTSV